MSGMPRDVSVRDFGARGDGVADDAPAIQAALDSGARRVVVPAGLFRIRNVLIPLAGQCLVIDGTIRVADAEVQPLARDVSAGEREVEVPDTSGFAVGEWVTLHDERLPIQGGGHKTRRQNAGNARIVAIDGRRIALDRASARDYRRAARAVLARQHGAIWIRHPGVRVCGTGVIDGNQARQLDAAPCPLENRAGEDWRVGCGVAARGDGMLRDIVIEGVTVRDTLMHGICLWHVERGVIRNTACLGSHDKNITLWGCRDCLVEGNLAADSGWEDGIMLHQVRDSAEASCRVLIRGNVCVKNPRYGLHVGHNMRDIHLAGNLCADNGLNLSIYGDCCTSTGDTAIGTEDRLFIASVYRPNVLLGGRRVSAVNLTALGTHFAGIELSGSETSLAGGLVGEMEEPGPAPPGGVVVAEGAWGRGSGEFHVAGDCRIGIALVPGLTGNGQATCAERVRVSGVRVTGCRVGAMVAAGVRRVVLEDNDFSGNEQPAMVAEPAWPALELAGNDGLLSRRRGLARVPPDRDRVRVAHGLCRAPGPGEIMVTPAGHPGKSGRFWLDKVDAQGFDIVLDRPPGEGGAAFAWLACLD